MLVFITREHNMQHLHLTPGILLVALKVQYHPAQCIPSWWMLYGQFLPSLHETLIIRHHLQLLTKGKIYISRRCIVIEGESRMIEAHIFADSYPWSTYALKSTHYDKIDHGLHVYGDSSRGFHAFVCKKSLIVTAQHPFSPSCPTWATPQSMDPTTNTPRTRRNMHLRPNISENFAQMGSTQCW